MTMKNIYRLVGSSDSHWCDRIRFPKIAPIYSPLLRTEVSRGFSRGEGRARFLIRPPKDLDILSTSSGLLYSEKFVEAVKEYELDGLEFFHVMPSPGSRDLDRPWFRGYCAGSVEIDPDHYSGSAYDMCPVTGREKRIEGGPLETPPRGIRLTSIPTADFFMPANVSINWVFLSPMCKDRLVSCGFPNLKFDIYEQS